MKAIENKATLFETLEPKLVADDDRALWQAALLVLMDEFTQRQGDESPPVINATFPANFICASFC